MEDLFTLEFVKDLTEFLPKLIGKYKLSQREHDKKEYTSDDVAQGLPFSFLHKTLEG